jgi:hypothetical protein
MTAVGQLRRFDSGALVVGTVGSVKGMSCWLFFNWLIVVLLSILFDQPAHVRSVILHFLAMVANSLDLTGPLRKGRACKE